MDETHQAASAEDKSSLINSIYSKTEFLVSEEFRLQKERSKIIEATKPHTLWFFLGIGSK